MRVAYGVGFLFVCFATFIAWKYLPARAAVFPGEDEHDDELMRAEAEMIGIEDSV